MTLLAADRSRSDILLDPRQVRDVFARELPGFASDGIRVEDCRILHTRYRTSPRDAAGGKAFLSVCYQLDVNDRSPCGRGRQVLHLKAYPPRKSRRIFERASRERGYPPRFGAAVAHLPSLEAVVWGFPNDPKLGHLPDVIDPWLVERHLPFCDLPPGFDSPASVRDVQVEAVRYKPEVRCTTRYELGSRLGADRLVIYGKTFGHGRAAEIARRMTKLWSRPARDRLLRVARPLGYSEAVKTVWQEALPGTPLDRVIDRGNYPGLLKAAAEGLARFHRTGMGGLPSSTPRDDLDAARGEVVELAQAFPRQAPKLREMIAGLERTLSSLDAHTTALVHGDFLLKQLVLHEGVLSICDFDNLSTGDPMRDLANFVVDLHFQDFDAGLAHDMAAAFLDAYAGEGGPLPACRLQWQLRLHVVRGACYFYKRRHGMPGFEDELARILRLAHAAGFDA